MNRYELDPEVRSYYQDRPEENRLEGGASQLEAVRTRSLLERYLPPPPAVVLDVGGAAGAYAIWLAGRGYQVHLIEPVERLREEARRRAAEAGVPLESYREGDARELPFQGACACAVLLLGPLYHLPSAEDRALALAEARRVTRAGGVVLAAAITRWASALDALAQDYFAIPGREAIVARAISDGQHRNLDGAGGFTTAYLHRPDELEREIRAAGLHPEALHAVEGFAGFLPGFDERWADPRQRADIVRLAEALDREPYLFGASPHLLAVARRPPDP